MKYTVLILSALVLMITSCAEKPRESETVQKTIAGGIIEGSFDADLGLELFHGIPFAQEPVIVYFRKWY